MAEGSFKKMVADKKLEEKIYCDSAGTSAYHIGEQPDRRMFLTAKAYDVHLDHCARQLVVKDFFEFDYILAMDKSNYQNILKIRPDEEGAKVHLFREFDTEQKSGDVPDPYYGGQDGFEEVFRIVERCNVNFLKHILENHQI
jgi:protein-tyrosine phosphatase